MTFDYVEFNKAVKSLKEKGYEVKVDKIFEGKICDIPLHRYDFIIHKSSYGHEKGLLEIADYRDGWTTLGWLNAEQVVDIITNHIRGEDLENYKT